MKTQQEALENFKKAWVNFLDKDLRLGQVVDWLSLNIQVVNGFKEYIQEGLTEVFDTIFALVLKVVSSFIGREELILILQAMITLLVQLTIILAMVGILISIGK